MPTSDAHSFRLEQPTRWCARSTSSVSIRRLPVTLMALLEQGDSRAKAPLRQRLAELFDVRRSATQLNGRRARHRRQEFGGRSARIGRHAVAGPTATCRAPRAVSRPTARRVCGETGPRQMTSARTSPSTGDVPYTALATCPGNLRIASCAMSASRCAASRSSRFALERFASTAWRTRSGKSSRALARL